MTKKNQEKANNRHSYRCAAIKKLKINLKEKLSIEIVKLHERVPIDRQVSSRILNLHF